MTAISNTAVIDLMALPNNTINAASGWIIAQPYANDIMALDLTGASLNFTSAPIAAINLGWS